MSILNDRQTDVIPERAAIPRHACVLTTVRIIVLTLLFGAPLGFGEGTGGLVREVNGEIVTVAFAGPMPHVGDDVEFFFEMEGLAVEISIASGKVIAVDESGLLKVKIEKATGTVEKEHLARFSSNTADTSVLPNKPSPQESPPERHTLTPVPTPMPSATPTVSAPAASATPGQTE